VSTYRRMMKELLGHASRSRRKIAAARKNAHAAPHEEGATNVQKGQLVSVGGCLATVRGYTSDGWSVVLQTEDGEHYYVPRSDFPDQISGVMAPCDALPPPRCAGRGVEGVEP